MHTLRFLLLALICMALVPSTGFATAPDCAAPRSAASSLFEGLDPDNYDPAVAKACLELKEGDNGERLAVQLKQVLDANGLYMPVDSLPTDPNYTNEAGEYTVIPLPDFPVLAITRGQDGKWRYAAGTMAAVPQLYAETFSPLSVWFQSNLPNTFYNRILGVYLWQYLYAVLLILGAWLIAQLVRALLKGQVRRLIARAHLKLDDRTYARTNAPIVIVVFVGILLWGLPDLQLGIGLSVVAHKVLNTLVWLAALLALSRFVDVAGSVARSWSEHTESKLDDQAVPLLQQAAQMLVLVLAALFIADALGIDVWKLAAGVGIGGLAFALAAQDTVANVFGSINIFIDRPFQIGDWVQIGSVEGVVEEVGFRSTRVRTFYNSLVTIPNSQITNANVDNLGLRPRRRIKLTLGLMYDTPPDKVQAYVEGVRAILTAHPYVEATYEVHLYNLSDSSLDILVYYHVITPGWHEELVSRSQNLLEFMRLAEALGVSFAFPSTSVYVESTPDHPRPVHPSRQIGELQETVNSFGPEGSRARPAGPPFTKSWSVQERGLVNDRGNAE